MESSLFAQKWTPTAIQMLERLVGQGMTSGQISRALSDEFGDSFSRNSVVSKAIRLKLKFHGKCRANGASKNQRTNFNVSKKIAANPGIVKGYREDIAFVKEPAPKGDVHDGCRWMHGEPTSFNYCGAETYRGSYCQHHYARSTTMPPPGQAKRDRKSRNWLSRI